MKKKKKLYEDMQSKMIFKDHIDRVSTHVHYILITIWYARSFFSRDFTFQISSFNTIPAKRTVR